MAHKILTLNTVRALTQALARAQFDPLRASPLKHTTHCGFWSDLEEKAVCDCPIKDVVKALERLKKIV